MEINKQTAFKLWKIIYKEKTTAKDIFGVVINKFNYGLDKEGGWNLHHIKPISKGGTSAIGNIVITSIKPINKLVIKLQS